MSIFELIFFDTGMIQETWNMVTTFLVIVAYNGRKHSYYDQPWIWTQKKARHVDCAALLYNGIRGGIWTRTGVAPLGPQPNASANSATRTWCCWNVLLFVGMIPWSHGIRGGIWTRTGVTPLGPQPNASANSATRTKSDNTLTHFPRISRSEEKFFDKTWQPCQDSNLD